MAIAKDVDCAAVQQFTGGTSKVVSMTGVAAGASIIVFVGTNTFGGGTPTYTVNDGNAYSEITSRVYSSTNGKMSIFLLQSVAGGSVSITVTSSVGTFGRAWATSFTGLGTYSAADTPVVNSGTSTTPATGSSATLSQADMLIVTGFCGNGTWTGTPTLPAATGYTALHDSASAGSSIPAAYDYKIVAATTAVSANIGTTVNDVWAAVLCMLPQASAAGGGRLVSGSLVGGSLIGVLA